jgi:salicylate hydroxylase
VIDRKPRIAIVGAGVGGLTLWLALRERGLSADIYEQTHELTEIGAAVALSANATRELDRLGVLDPIVAASTEPTELVYRDGRTGGRITAHPVRLGGAYRGRFGAPFCGIHRADVQRALSAGVDRERLHLGRRVVDLSGDGDRVTLSFADGGTVEADAVIAADGVRSVARRFVGGDDGLLYSRTSGFRGIVPVEKLPSLPDPDAIQFWMGPSAHLLHYAIGADGGHVNFLAVVEGPP